MTTDVYYTGRVRELLLRLRKAVYLRERYIGNIIDLEWWHSVRDIIQRWYNWYRRTMPGSDAIPCVLYIDAAILDRMGDNCELNMSRWHTCATKHCRYGWAIHLAGTQGEWLESVCGPLLAGALIYAASRPHRPIPDYLGKEEHVIVDMVDAALHDQPVEP
jgi:hypothetical protein